MSDYMLFEVKYNEHAVLRYSSLNGGVLIPATPVCSIDSVADSSHVKSVNKLIAYTGY